MLNQAVIVGRVHSIGHDTVTIAVPRNYKNEQGEYDTDFITAKLVGSIKENVSKYCKNGDLVGIKGRLESGFDAIYLMAEKVTFLSSKSDISKGGD